MGLSVSLIVTVKLQVAVFPLLSVAEQVTGVAPTTNVVPLAGVQVKLLPGQLSLEVKITLALLHCPGSALATIFVQIITGYSVSLTVTVNEQEAVFPLASVTVKVFTVVPFGKAAPLGRPAVCTVFCPGQLSVPTGAA